MEEMNSMDTYDDGFSADSPVHTGRTLKRLWASTGDQHKRLALVLVSVALYTLLSVGAPLYSAYVVDLIFEKVQQAFREETAFSITWEAGGRDIFQLLLLYLATAFFYTLQSFLMASFAEKLSLRLRTEISQKLNRLPLSYFDRNQPGAILSRTTNDLDKMAEALQTGLLKLITAVGMVVGSLIMMLTFSLLLTGIFLFFMAISLVATRYFSGRTLRYALRRQECTGRVTSLVEESYSGRAILKAFNQEAQSAARLHQATEELAEATRRTDFLVNAINPAIRLINRLGQVLLAVAGGNMLLKGTMTVGVFQAFFQYVYQSSEPLTEVAYMVNSMQSALASLERIYEMLDEEELSPEAALPASPQKPLGQVEFSHVRFGYRPDAILMQDINFSVQPGQKVAIVGSTGAGKTTLVNLLMRFYEVNAGSISLDGTPIDAITRAGLRKHFGMVLQDTWLFEGTIAENIAYSRPEATREEIIAAAKAARADFFIRTMPQGYDTVLGNDTETISAGQRQLLTIARVFLRNPAVLILDEATSSVDTRTEMEISKAMKALMKGRTSFVIAHRLSTIVDADRILFMESGTITEQGTHQSLLAQGGAYARLYNSQFS